MQFEQFCSKDFRDTSNLILNRSKIGPITLYSVSLECRFTPDFLWSKGYGVEILFLALLILLAMLHAIVNFLSRCIPRYLTLSSHLR